MSFRDNNGIVIIIVLFILANLIVLNFYSDVWWDSSVYMGMGKYIFSIGKSGLWEESRPLVFPLILGVGWKLGLDVIYFGRVISVIFAILVIFMTYKIGNKLFSKRTGLLAAFFTAFSYNFLFFSPNILTEMPSTLFVLLAFYFFIDNKYFLMGLFSGIAIMTRLFQIFTFVGLGMIFIVYFYRKPNFFKKLFYIIIGASIFILPYIFLNYYLYNDVLLPFKVQTHLTQTTGWMLYKEFGFYFAGLFKENFFIIFLLAAPFFFKNNHKFYALFMIPLVYILIFSFVKHKEMRFMLVILPFLYLTISYIIIQIYNKMLCKKLAFAFFSVMVVVWLIMTFLSFKNIVLYKHQRNDEAFLHFQNYLKNNNGGIWVTSPLYALYSDNKIDGLLYFYSSENLINFVNKNKDSVDIVLFNSCDILCPPAELDFLCLESRKILRTLLSNFKKIYQKEINSCKYEIYRRFIS